MKTLILALDGVRSSTISPSMSFELSNKQVIVFDDIFTSDFVDAMSIFLLRQNYEYRQSFDNELSAAFSNDFICSLPVITEVATGILEHFRSDTIGYTEQVLSHGYAAAIRFGDSCVLHKDIDCDDCMTFLYYGNVVWSPRWGGETVIYSDDFESVVCVTPKPGRLVFFNASLHHRAGIPTKECPTFRYGLSLFYRCSAMMGRARPTSDAEQGRD